MLRSINKRDSAEGVSVYSILYTHHKQPVLFFNRYVTVDCFPSTDIAK